MDMPQMEYRRVKLPRTEMFFSACWFDIGESMDIFAHFADFEPAKKLYSYLKSIGYDPSIHTQDWVLPQSKQEPVAYWEVMLFLEAPRFNQTLWASGEAITEEEACKQYASMDELKR